MIWTIVLAVILLAWFLGDVEDSRNDQMECWYRLNKRISLQEDLDEGKR